MITSMISNGRESIPIVTARKARAICWKRSSASAASTRGELIILTGLIITSLIGIRVFFLYREDWIYFHNYITTVFENDPENYVEDRIRDFDEDPEHFYIAERPKVYRRNGDTRIYDEELIDIKSDGIYRSLHYIIKYRGYYVEIQGRTLFEEGWSEIDHDIVYPYFKDDEMLKDFSTLLNRLSGMADEMSSYFRRMKSVREEPGKNRKERRALTGGGNIWTEQEERERK